VIASITILGYFKVIGVTIQFYIITTVMTPSVSITLCCSIIFSLLIGHSCKEDAATCIELMMWKIKTIHDLDSNLQKKPPKPIGGYYTSHYYDDFFDDFYDNDIYYGDDGDEDDF